MECFKCKHIIENREYLVCSSCKNTYHSECANVSSALFYLMRKESKEKWKCQVLCYSDSNNLSLLNSSIQRSGKNITTRKKYKINVSTGNSFESLSEDDNMEYTSMTETSLNRSCPEIGASRSDVILALTEKNTTLKEKLEIAENEIENMLAESFTLKKQLSEYKLRIEQLTHICKSTPLHPGSKCSTMKKKKKDMHRMKLDFSISTQEETESQKAISNECGVAAPSVKSSENLMKTDDTDPKGCPQNTSCIDIASPVQQIDGAKSIFVNKQDLNLNLSKNKLYLIGDEQLRNVSQSILESRHEKWNNNYVPFGFIMPNARSSEILTYCSNISSNLTDKDIVVLSVGSHDNNPGILHYNLCLILNVLRQATVYIVPVNKNKYLNEYTLNYYLKLWTKHLSNCYYIEPTSYNLSDHEFLNFICKKINYNIDINDYRLQFLNFKNAMKLCKKNNFTKCITNVRFKEKLLTSKNSSSIPHSQPKKGTIPYYFPIVNRELPNQNIPEEFFRP